jgi:RNA polymerase sigma-70 factor (TIGR02960 family)
VTGAPPQQFAAETEGFRRELLVHCYRMLGSTQDAEDLVQDTYLRAWRFHSEFEGRASLRSWLYKIATNVCLSALKSRPLRVLPSGLAGPYDGPERPPSDVATDVSWLEPFPDAWLASTSNDPAAVVSARQSVRLALIASLQHLPPRQRAIFLLREVVAFSAEETAELLGMTTAAVKSGLQRARDRMAALDPEPEALLEPTDPRARELLAGYIAAFERSDAALLIEVLRADATLEATPFRDWKAGRVGCIHLLVSYLFGAPGDWRMLATIANGQPAAAVYHRASGVLHASDIVVLAPTPTGVSRVVAFHDPKLVERFGFPSALAD